MCFNVLYLYVSIVIFINIENIYLYMESILINLQKMTKEKLKQEAKRQRRSVNTLVNISIEKYILGDNNEK